MNQVFLIQNVSSLELHLGSHCSIAPGAIIDLLERGFSPNQILSNRLLSTFLASKRLIYIEKPGYINHTLETLRTGPKVKTITNKLTLVDIEDDYTIESGQDLIIVHGSKDIIIQLPSAENIGTPLFIKKYDDNANKVCLRTQIGQKLDAHTHRYNDYDVLVFTGKHTIHLVAAEYEWLVLTNLSHLTQAQEFFVITDDSL